MKVKQMILLGVLAGILFTALSLTGGQAKAQENLLNNSGFEEGYFNQDGIPIINGFSRIAVVQVDSNVSALSDLGWVALAAEQAATPAPTVTPRADGAVVHVVQAGDTFWSLAIQYAGVMGLTAEEALTAIPALNNNPATINPGDELIIVPPSATATPEPEPTAVETATPEAEATNDSGESVSVEETAATATAVNGVCVAVYEDTNKDAVYSLENENLLAEVTVSLLLDGATEASYVTDGANEPYCFEDLEPGTYQVQVFPSEAYQATTPESWAIAVSNGVIIPVTFGLVPAPEATDVVSETVENGGATVVGVTAVPENAQAEDSGGLGNIGGILLIGIAFVILLAGGGIFLLRRG